MQDLIKVGTVLAFAALTCGAELDVAPQVLSTNVSEVIRLAESDIEEPIILAFIEAARTPFKLSADEVVYLKDIGIAPGLVTGMLHHDAVLREQNLGTGVAVAANAPAAPGTNAAAPVLVTNAPPPVAYFYDSLAPYGTWIELEGLGWCWQPRAVVIDRGWRPYWHGGRWIYTDSDWYWYSDYSWGWAPFHYGRWHRHPHSGWVWFPDLVWAPAWVCWRYSDTHCGWAPLPLGAHFVTGHGFRFNGVSAGVDFDFHLGLDFFTFVELGHFHERHPHLHGVPHARVADVYRNTTVINNYVAGNNNTVINRGVPVGRVAVAGRREIHPVEIRESRPASDGRVDRERLEPGGKTPVLHRPPLQAPVKPPQVSAQRVNPQHPIMRQTARPPAGGLSPGDRRTTIAQPAATPPQAQPVSPVPRQPAPTQPDPQSRLAPERTLPLTPLVRRNFPPARAESPKGREQRISNGRPMEPSRPRPAPPPRAPSGPRRGDGEKQSP